MHMGNYGSPYGCLMNPKSANIYRNRPPATGQILHMLPPGRMHMTVPPTWNWVKPPYGSPWVRVNASK